MKLSSVLWVATVAISASNASAQPQFFSDKSAFLQAAGVQRLESFEALLAGECTTTPLTLPGVVVTGPPGIRVRAVSELGLHPTDGLQYFRDCEGNNPQVWTVSFDFSCGTRTFGISMIDFGDVNSHRLTLTTDTGIDHLISSTPPNLPDGNVIFVGLISDSPFSQASIVRTRLGVNGDGTAFDELYFTALTVSEPASVSTCSSSTVMFAVNAVGLDPLSYRWQIESVPPGSNSWNDISDGPINGSSATASGTAAPTLTITDAQPAAAARYRCRVTDSCANLNSHAATLSVCDRDADLNCDGRVDLPDLATLLSHFGTPSGASRADGDLDGDGDVDLPDLALLLAGFGANCP
ncbi:MAG: hypothetical protein ACKVS9_17025 [Phycisphaerae bacterium]